MIAIFTSSMSTINPKITYSPKNYFIIIKEEKDISRRHFTGIIIDNTFDKINWDLLELLYERQPELDNRPIIIK